jgi:hypothetical protein
LSDSILKEKKKDNTIILDGVPKAFNDSLPRINRHNENQNNNISIDQDLNNMLEELQR